MKRVILLLLVMVLIPMVSAEISLEQPDSLYNFGDELNMDIIVRASSPSEGFLITNIFCGNSSYEIFRSYLSLDPEEEFNEEVNFVFGNSLNLLDQDECYVKATFDYEEVESQRFQVSRRIAMGVSSAKRIFEPGERVNLDGTATKINGEPVNGIVDVEISPTNLTLPFIVRDGNFAANFTIPEDISGALRIHFFSYEEDRNGVLTNKGTFDLEVSVRQTLKSIELEVQEGDIIPGKDISIKAKMLDQAGLEMVGDLSLNIIDPDRNSYSQNVIKTGEEFIFETETGFQPGYWKIEVSVGETVTNKLIYLEEINDLVFKLANGTLFVTNIGNVAYSGPIEVTVGSENIVKQIEVGPGETASYRLSAPDGNYQVEVKKSGEEFSLGTTPLTGRVIGVGGGGFDFVWGNNLAIWIFLVFMLALAILMVHYRKGIAKEMALLRRAKKKSVPGNSLVSSGHKVEAGFLVLDIDNNSEILSNIIQRAKSYKAGVSYDGTHRIMLFAPHLTNEKDNSTLTVKVAKEIEDIINIYNMKHSNQINYSIGAGLGEIIAEKKEGKLKFVSVGNIMSSTKRLATEAKNEILISGKLKEKITGTEFKLGKSKVEGVWKVEGVRRERETHKKFIRDFLDKN